MTRRRPEPGDVWQSRDRRDSGLTVTVLSIEGGPDGFVWIKRFRKSRVRLRRFHEDYSFVESERGGA